MVQPFIVLVAALPLIFRLIGIVVPPAYLEPYAYWSAESLNRRDGETQATTRWRNMGYWKDTDSFPDAAEALGRRLIAFAEAPKGGAVLDIAHGAGESLRLHSMTTPPPSHLHGLTSIRAETEAAAELLGVTPHPNTSVELFTGSAAFRPGKDFDHPLNPMKGFLGRRRAGASGDDATGYEDEDDIQAVLDVPSSPPPYDFVYILDAIYHFPPSVPHFLFTTINSLRPGTGVIAYTDILPPTELPNAISRLILPWLLSVPTRNISDRPKTLDEYTAMLEKMGYTDVRIEDWSDGVWRGFAANLSKRSWLWQQVAWVVGKAEQSGWRFIAVRATRGDSPTQQLDGQ